MKIHAKYDVTNFTPHPMLARLGHIGVIAYRNQNKIALVWTEDDKQEEIDTFSDDRFYDSAETAARVSQQISDPWCADVAKAILTNRVKSFWMNLHIELSGDTMQAVEPASKPANNDGRTECAWCNSPTKKVDTGFFKAYDICSSCGR